MCSNFYGSELDLSAARELNEGGRFYDISKMPGPLGYLDGSSMSETVQCNTEASQRIFRVTSCLTDLGPLSLVLMLSPVQSASA